ncbi:sulfatase family protein [Labilibacter marinus]|uniref:sulfatase family protein n=1 Tax=Labilibacter marinus TaxID=1477105 RepID=UPI0018EA1825|nr:sulfatase-like hydrolase/transferase [Labilibacter marinus]
MSTTKFVISAKERPNIILIMTDDQGWFDAGFNGNKMIQTPNLDALAQQGVIFDRFYSASSVCSPTRASVMTGRNPNRMGIPSANTGHLKLEEITIAELLRKEGYATGHFGKWHLGTLTKKVKDANRGGKEKHFEHFTIPSMHGYDEFFCTESKVPTYDPMIYPTTFKEGESKKYGWTAVAKGERSEAYNTFYWVDNEQKASNDLSGDDTKLIVDQVIPFIHQSVSNKKPFFTTVWPHTPHLPVVTSEYYKNKYAHLSNKEQLYYGCITALDEQVGRLWQELKELGLAENTMIWFCSDNGPENGTPGSAGKFRARKRSLYEGGLRTPAFVVWKKELAGNQRLDFPAYTSDYMPTILNILNIEYPDNRPVDGMDIMPLIQHSSMQREKPMGFQFNNRISWVTHQYKLISEDAGKTFELYDLINDEKEQNNIIQNNSELAQHMKEDLLEWKKSVSHSLNGNDY